MLEHPLNRKFLDYRLISKKRVILMRWCFYAACLMLFPVITLNAAIIQILHTNDIHSFFDHALQKPDRGGYARLKEAIKKYKEEAAEKGIKTFVVDAGDFLEGNFLYMADRGRKSLQLHNEIGYDAVVVGNHDYLMGVRGLDDLLGEVPPNFAFLGANFSISSYYRNIRSHIKPYHKIELDGLKIAFLGLTTDEPQYKWRIGKSGEIKDPLRLGRKWGRRLKGFIRRYDAVIALTHLGLKTDKELVETSRGIDLVIGGHSHDFLQTPVYIDNKLGESVPIVQAGHTGEVMGRLLLDIRKGQPLKVLEYELIPIEALNSDPYVEGLVRQAKEDLNQVYGEAWLSEVLGHSFLPAHSEEARAQWSSFVTEAIQEATGAQIAFHSPLMVGKNYPMEGPITRYHLFDGHPRFLNFKDKKGWSIYHTVINGFWIDAFARTAEKLGLPLTMVGLKFERQRLPSGEEVLRLLVGKNSRPLDTSKYYSVALPSGVVEGVIEFFGGPEHAFVFARLRQMNMSVIEAIEKKLFQSEGVVGAKTR